MNLIKRRDKGNGHSLDTARPTSMLELRNEMDRVLERFFREPWGLPFGGRLGGFEPMLEPVVDVSETDASVVVEAEVAGIDPEKLDVSVTEDALTIAGEKEETEEREGENSYRSERRFGSFRRTIPLPAPVDPDKVDAKFRNGVLRIELAKSAPSRSKRIPVKAS